MKNKTFKILIKIVILLLLLIRSGFSSKKSNENYNYCITNRKCLKKEWSLKDIMCECEEKYPFKCSDVYCTFNKQYCDLISLKIQYQKKLNKTDKLNCPLSSIHNLQLTPSVLNTTLSSHVRFLPELE